MEQQNKELNQMMKLGWLLAFCSLMLGIMIGAGIMYAMLPQIDLPEEHRLATPKDKFKCRFGEDKVWHVGFDNDVNQSK